MRNYTADEVDEMIGRALAREREQRKPLPKGEWPKHPRPYVGAQHIGYTKSNLDDYATQVLAAHGIKGDA